MASVVQKEALGGSKIGRQSISLPKGVEVRLVEKEVVVKGPKGELRSYLDPIVTISVEQEKVGFSIKNRFDNQEKAKHGLYNRLVRNMIIGVSEGFSRNLLLVGTGYRAKTSGKTLELSLGYSHPVVLDVPDGITCSVEENSTKIVLQGIQKDALGQFAADIRKKRPVEPYKGKGVRFENENVRRKAGKSGKK